MQKAVIDMARDESASVAASPAERDSCVVTALSDITDRALHAAMARFTMGLSPAAIAAAYLDWLAHLMAAPGKRLQLIDKMARKSLRFADFAWQQAQRPGKAAAAIEPLPQDRRFAGEAWQHPPFNLFYQGFLLQQQWWHNATSDVRGVTRHHEDSRRLSRARRSPTGWSAACRPATLGSRAHRGSPTPGRARRKRGAGAVVHHWRE
jgi:polyhydroxyalkanoate synthase